VFWFTLPHGGGALQAPTTRGRRMKWLRVISPRVAPAVAAPAAKS